MSINQLDSKKQLLILTAIIVLLFGLYVKFRLMPAMDQVAGTHKQLKADQQLLMNPNIPEEPLDDIEDLASQVEALEIELEDLLQQTSTLEKKLPAIDSQDVMLKISEVARSSRVRVVNNVPFLTKKRFQFGAKESDKKLSPAERRKREKQLRKAMKKARKKAAQQGTYQASGIYTTEGELMDKLVNDFAVSRPLHQLKIEGTYTNIQNFIKNLQGLPWQITVVKIDYKLLGANAAQGYPQPLEVDMIIGA